MKITLLLCAFTATSVLAKGGKDDYVGSIVVPTRLDLANRSADLCKAWCRSTRCRWYLLFRSDVRRTGLSLPVYVGQYSLLYPFLSQLTLTLETLV